MPEQSTNQPDPQTAVDAAPQPSVTAPAEPDLPGTLDATVLSSDLAAPAQADEALDDQDPDDQTIQESPDPNEHLAWQASEYVHHHKTIGWYLILAGVVVILAAIAVIFKLWLSIGVFVAMGAAIAVYAYKPPRTLSYQLDSTGVSIESKHYAYSNFRSFGVLSDIEWHTIDLEPTQRFMPRLTILFSDDDFDEIVAHLGNHLPRADRKPDLVERATRYLRF